MSFFLLAQGLRLSDCSGSDNLGEKNKRKKGTKRGKGEKRNLAAFGGNRGRSRVAGFSSPLLSLPQQLADADGSPLTPLPRLRVLFRFPIPREAARAALRSPLSDGGIAGTDREGMRRRRRRMWWRKAAREGWMERGGRRRGGRAALAAPCRQRAPSAGAGAASFPPGLQRHQLLQARSRFCDGKRWEGGGRRGPQPFPTRSCCPARRSRGSPIPGWGCGDRTAPQVLGQHPEAAGFPCPLREPRQLLDNRKQCVVNGKRGWRRLNNFPLHHCPNKEL